MSLLFILLSTIRVSGQAPMPDTVCEGATKHYWVDPTSGSTYIWKINGITLTTSANNIVINWDGSYPQAGSPYTLTVQELSATGCYGEVKSGMVYIKAPLPVSISVTPGQNPACNGVPVTFTASASNTGTNPAYAWHVNYGATAGTGSTFNYIPANGDVVTCEVSSNASCAINNPAVSSPVIMQISENPSVIFVPCFDTITTANAKPFKLKGGLPLGGNYTGIGVNTLTRMFSPAVAGVGTNYIKYSYENVAGCTDSAFRSIYIYPASMHTCGAHFTDIRDNKSYPTVQIGTQCWLAANMNYGTGIQATQVQGDNCIAEKYCYNNVPANCTSNGGLYEWDELMKYDNTPASQGICPPGWHVPTATEWMTLFNYYNGNAFAGSPLKDTLTIGFHALPGGVLYQNNTWSFNNVATIFWSSTPAGSGRVISYGLNIYDGSSSYYESLKANSLPVRCLKD